MKQVQILTENEQISSKFNLIIKNSQQILRKLEKKLGKNILRFALYLFLLDIAFIFLFPFLHMIVTSLKTNADLYDPTVNWIPRNFKYQNYVMAYKGLEYFKYFKNSAIYTVIGTIGHILSCSFIGYGFARYKVPGDKILFFIVLLGIIIPIQTLIVPYYMLYANLKWLNTYLPITVPTFFGYGLRGGIFILVFRQFYFGLPKALEDAAKIDGCSFLRVYWNIALPVVKSAFIVTLILSIAWHWNDFYEPMMYNTNSAFHTLPKRLNRIQELVFNPPKDFFSEYTGLVDQEKVINSAVLMAATFQVLLPVIIVFSFLQKKFMQGIERTGLVE